ncbi:class I SAM-dependent methyltransferase [Nibricoccus aquaticus]|uniref:class I SAM-dependent methyltransferase n=1 Tax=Nibricoccus aquaticus TaxID=2576891 RepID=UPI001FE748CA|nr:class I SAM-dependent methyltransferase [Nibricoccus aquaticus]
MSAKISAATVRDDFNDPVTVVHYTRAAHFLGLWESERILIERFFPDKTAPLLEAGCGAGRATLGLWHLGYRDLTAFDFAEELLDQARQLATDQGVTAIHFLHADATKLTSVLHDSSSSSVSQPSALNSQPAPAFAGALFLFNGLMQIPGRDHRRAALRELHAVCRTGAPLLFTTHDRDVSPTERALWRLEILRWENGTQDPRLVDFGDRYFEDETGRTFMHLPDRAEILEDLAATGWTHTFDSLRRDIAKESRAVRDFSDECRFWSAVRT